MARTKRPKGFREIELLRLRQVWQKAREGDQESRYVLLKLLSAHKSVDAFVRYWTELKAKPIPKAKTKKKNDWDKPLVAKEATPKIQSPWERARMTLTKGSIHVVGGGLPSLGKHSK